MDDGKTLRKACFCFFRQGMKLLEPIGGLYTDLMSAAKEGGKGMEYWDLYDSERKPLNRVHKRGEAFSEGEYYVCSEVWVRNSRGQFLITKRHPDKKAGNLWEFTGGGTLAGESTLESAVRELKEETGIDASESELRLFATYRKKNYFQDLFLLDKDVDIADIVLKPDETVDVEWAKVGDILEMIEKGEIVHSVGIRFQMYRELVSGDGNAQSGIQ